MALNYINSDIFASLNKGDVLLHGCNAQGVMGSGIAAQIKKRYPDSPPTPMFITSLTDLIDVTVDVVKTAVKTGFNRLMNVLRVQTEVQRLSFAT